MHANDTMCNERFGATRKRFTVYVHGLWDRWIEEVLVMYYHIPMSAGTDLLALSY